MWLRYFRCFPYRRHGGGIFVCSMRNFEERRHFTRVSIQIEGEICIDDTATISGISRDVSLNGLFFVCDPAVPIGTRCRVTLFLGDREKPQRLEACARIVRQEKAGVGLTFTEITGVDSFAHLRNLVLYNANAESRRVEEEFRTHCGIKGVRL